MPERLVAGRVGRAHGLDGSFHVVAPRPALLWLGAPLTVSGRPAEVVRRAGTDAHPIVRLSGCEDRAGAEALRGEELRIPAEDAPELGEDEWYAEELEGCAVLDGDAPVGEVRRLLALPSCEVLEVARPGREDLLVPLIADAVRAVDVADRRIDVDLGFLEPDG